MEELSIIAPYLLLFVLLLPSLLRYLPRSNSVCYCIFRGLLWVHPTKPRWRGDDPRHRGLREFLATLVTNFPTLLVRHHLEQEVRLVAIPRDHPLTATVDEHGTLAISTSIMEPPRVTAVSSQPDLVK